MFFFGGPTQYIPDIHILETGNSQLHRILHGKCERTVFTNELLTRIFSFPIWWRAERRIPNKTISAAYE